MKIKKSQIPKGAKIESNPNSDGYFEGSLVLHKGDDMAIFFATDGVTQIFKSTRPILIQSNHHGMKFSMLFYAGLEKNADFFEGIQRGNEIEDEATAERLFQICKNWIEE